MHLQDTRISGKRPTGQQGTIKGPALVFNYLPVQFAEASFDAGTFPYESSEQLEGLRTRLAKTHTVIRLQDQVVCVPFVSDSELVGDPVTFGTDGPDLLLATRLLQAALIRVLTKKWKFSLRKLKPLTFVSRLRGRDLMEKVLSLDPPPEFE
ncbi:MAG: hypothetical protein JO345_02250 [Streptosporangiaceae bacterium]|nr:hypothetical protein [Streptosporangiaceae bacterium]